MRTLRYSLVALCLQGILALPSAHAGLTVTTLQPGDSGIVPGIGPGMEQMPTGHGVSSQARYVETRTSRLVNPATQQLEYLNEQADSGWVSTQQLGKRVTAYASVDLTPIDTATFVYPAAAKSTLFGNHVRAVTNSRLTMENDVEVTVNGVKYPAFTLFKNSSNSADARSSWYDVWQADATGTYPLTVRLDGIFSQDPGCPGCGLALPAGITSVQTRSAFINFEASFTVVDLDTLVDCDNPDVCGLIGPRPKAVARLTATYTEDEDDNLPLSYDASHTLDFSTIAGHRYLVMGQMEAGTLNGGWVSFENSLRLTGVGAPVGALTSSALGGDLASGFQQPVPEPATALLWAAGLAGWLTMRRRAGMV